MFYRSTKTFLAATSAIALCPLAPAYAQDTAPEQGAETAEAENVIMVTARRKDENLQEVPQTVNAVSGDTLASMRITNAADIQQLVAGVNIEGSSAGSGTIGASTSIRGVPTFTISNANPVVQYYLNDAPAGRNTESFSNFLDIGQVEVLKGPQGTLRGRSAPSGSITITTRKPDLNEVGGYVYLSGTERSNINAQAAVGAPLIPGVLAVRLAGVVDHNDLDGVTSANNRISPYSKTQIVRGTVSFEPTENVSASVMVQHLARERRTFAQVIGTGNGLPVPNGPVIVAEDRLGITDDPTTASTNLEFVSGQADWSFAGQKLSYVGSYRDAVFLTLTPLDSANVVRGGEYFTNTDSREWEMSHELRLSSEERIADIFDYTVGVFYDRNKGTPVSTRAAAFTAGAFGSPFALPVPGDPNPRYTLFNTVDIRFDSRELSAFGNLTAHLGERTEISVGGRYITYKRDDGAILTLASAFNATRPDQLGTTPANLAAVCGAIPGAVTPSPVYGAAVCDTLIPGRVIQNLANKETFKPWVFNASASHKISDDFMVFANVGSAFRTAGPTIGLQGVVTCCTAPSTLTLAPMTDLVFHAPEKSRTYEVGFKSSFFDRRARLNVSLFKQTFDNYFFLTQPTRYLSISNPANPASTTTTSIGSPFEFTASADATVEGIDVEAGFEVTPRWSVNLGFSYSNAKFKGNQVVPCNDGNFDGTPDTIVPTVQGFLNAGVIVARCPRSGSIARTPKWNLTAQSEYQAPVSSEVDGFVRGNLVLYPRNPFASDGFVAKSYSLVNLFAGIRSPDAVWEVAAFVQNLTNTKQITSRNAVPVTSAANVSQFFGNVPSGYNQIGYTPRREIGLSVRYAFGSR